MASAASNKRERDTDTSHQLSAKKKSSFFLPKSNFKGRFPSAIQCTFYNSKTKHPFMCSIILETFDLAPLIIYSVMQYYNITELKYESIYLYGFQFIEKDIEHPLIIVNEDICKEAMNECKKQQINPYNKKSENTKEAASAATSIKTEASDIPEGSPSRDLDKYNEILKKEYLNIKFTEEDKSNSVIISTSFILCYFLKKIINKTNEQTIQINAEPYMITGYDNPNPFMLDLHKMLMNAIFGQ
tara:strand:+ start:4020 stop:4748 length:729 start_codon:yes stop_codon:yes gene_type:complete